MQTFGHPQSYQHTHHQTRPVLSICGGQQTPQSLPQAGAVGGGTASAVATGRAAVEVGIMDVEAEELRTFPYLPGSVSPTGTSLVEEGCAFAVSVPFKNSQTVGGEEEEQTRTGVTTDTNTTTQGKPNTLTDSWIITQKQYDHMTLQGDFEHPDDTDSPPCNLIVTRELSDYEAKVEKANKLYLASIGKSTRKGPPEGRRSIPGTISSEKSTTRNDADGKHNNDDRLTIPQPGSIKLFFENN